MSIFQLRNSYRMYNIYAEMLPKNNNRTGYIKILIHDTMIIIQTHNYKFHEFVILFHKTIKKLRIHILF